MPSLKKHWVWISETSGCALCLVTYGMVDVKRCPVFFSFCHFVSRIFLALKCKFADFQSALYCYDVGSTCKWTMFTHLTWTEKFTWICQQKSARWSYCSLNSIIVKMKHYGNSFLTAYGFSGWQNGSFFQFLVIEFEVLSTNTEVFQIFRCAVLSVFMILCSL